MIAESLILSTPVAVAGAPSRRGPNRPIDEARFDTFYRQTAGGLWSYLQRLTGDGAAADDLLQKSFFRILRANPSFATDEHMRRYLYRTATNLAFDYFRENRKAAEQPFVEPVQAPDRSELRHDMGRVFAELKPRERALLWLAHVEGLDHEEIAKALDLKSRSVRVLLFRARKRLADILARRGIGPEVLQ